MKTSNYQSWWREMGAISRGMMFLEGNIATPTDLDGVEQAGQVPAPASTARRSPITPGPKGNALHLYRDLLFLGGRPMTAGHNDDIDEPFPQPGVDFAEPQASRHWFGEPRRNPTPPSQACATC